MENLVCSASVLAQDPGSIMHTQLLNSQEENGGRHAKNRTIIELESQVRISYVSSPALQTVREAIKPDCKLPLIQEIHM